MDLYIDINKNRYRLIDSFWVFHDDEYKKYKDNEHAYPLFMYMEIPKADKNALLLHYKLGNDICSFNNEIAILVDKNSGEPLGVFFDKDEREPLVKNNFCDDNEKELFANYCDCRARVISSKAITLLFKKDKVDKDWWDCLVPKKD